MNSYMDCAVVDDNTFFVSYTQFKIRGYWLLTDGRDFPIDGVKSVFYILAYYSLIPSNRSFISKLCYDYRKLAHDGEDTKTKI
jgi:hypothetical protein